jgi:hypothetical protein
VRDRGGSGAFGSVIALAHKRLVIADWRHGVCLLRSVPDRRNMQRMSGAISPQDG